MSNKGDRSGGNRGSASANKGFYEPCWEVVDHPVPLPAVRRAHEEVYQKLALKHDALEKALEWIEMRCDTKEFPATHYLIRGALNA